MSTTINHKNFIYLEGQAVVFGYVPKVACTNWKFALRRIQGFTNYQDFEIAHDRKRSGLRFLDPLDTNDARILESPEIKKIAFVRNPYSRVLSAYLNKVDRFNKSRDSLTAGDHWSDVYNNILAFANDQYHHRSIGRVFQRALKITRKRRNSSNVNFSTFLMWLKDPRTPQHLAQNEHWAPQCQILHYPRFKMDFIGRFENLSYDASVALNMMGAKFEFSRSNAAGHQTTNATSSLDKYYGKKETFLVNDLFNSDFKAFGYDRMIVST
ncbi:sulfotransferase family protein [Ruegeria sp. B32]|uniref:sulfotransferase family protein n=1 Tax=Ruegeria sp. B32 TaxID=2867020 RepID=UPI0021A805F5|nr:sulfotransferase family protein [Ruegeria sp. B32]UWR08986.1 sulfotransferase family protein [Ruegeria sp. B32]